MLFFSLLLPILFARSTDSAFIETRPSAPRNFLLEITGNQTQLDDDLDGILLEASNLRNDTPCQFGDDWYRGGYGAVASVDFVDETRWAVKISLNSDDTLFYIARGHNSTRLMERYCPNIRVPQIRSQVSSTRSQSLVYYFMDWVDGIPLHRYEEIRHPENHTETASDNYGIVDVPATTVKQLAAFLYNITTCPIPVDEMARFYANTAELPLNLAEKAVRHPIATLKARLIDSTGLLLSSPGGVLAPLEKMLILAWMSNELRSTKYDPFVLFYWDLRSPNIIVDPHYNIKGIVDWDNVYARPLRQAAVSLEHLLFPFYDGRSLNETKSELFHQEFERLEWEATKSQNISAYLRQSLRNCFLSGLAVRPQMVCGDSMGIPYLGELMEDACRLSSENLKAAASEWQWFTDIFFRQFGRPVPDWPQYVQIQQRLGKLDKWNDFRHDMRTQVYNQLRSLFHHISQEYPGWKWAAKMSCISTAAVSDKYRFPDPSGKYWCS